MTIPPSLPPGQGPVRKPDPKHGHAPDHFRGKNPWLIVGCVLAGLLLVAAVILYLLTDMFAQGGYDYDDGNRHEKALRQTDRDETEEPVPDMMREEPLPQAPADTSCVSGVAGRRLHGIGTNGEKAISLDLVIDDDGRVSGKYWNIIYNIEFDISGHRQSDGTLDMTLTTVKDHVSTPLTLRTTDGRGYSGIWGKKHNPVYVVLHDGAVSSVPAPGIDITGHVKGPGDQAVLNDDFHITQKPDGTLYFWYPSQGWQSRLKVRRIGSDLEVYDRSGRVQASIAFPDAETMTGVMRDNDGQTFTVTLYP